MCHAESEILGANWLNNERQARERERKTKNVMPIKHKTSSSNREKGDRKDQKAGQRQEEEQNRC
jgi:hypothetical protein